MSRTKRSKTHGYPFRAVRTKAVITAEHYAAQEMEEAGFNGGNRQKHRANPTGSIPDAYDDVSVSAYRETDHRK